MYKVIHTHTCIYDRVQRFIMKKIVHARLLLFWCRFLFVFNYFFYLATPHIYCKKKKKNGDRGTTSRFRLSGSHDEIALNLCGDSNDDT